MYTFKLIDLSIGDATMLYTGCILSDDLPPNAMRVSVMSRHTLNGGKTPDERLVWRFDLHLASLGPSPNLIGRYYKQKLPWLEFAEEYIAELQDEEKSADIARLVQMAITRDIVILCIENSPEFCHRRLLAEECQRRFPELEVVVR